MPENLIIVGASVRAAASSAIRSDFSPWCADLFADADLAAACPTQAVRHYPRDLVQLLRSAPPGPWMYTGALENAPHVVDVVSRERPLLGISGEALRSVRDPWAVAAALHESEIICPRLIRDAKGVPRHGWWLCKRKRSAGGVHVRTWDGQRRADERDHRAYYFQQYVEGIPCGAVYVAARGAARLLGITEQLIGAPWAASTPYRYAGSMGPLAMASHQWATLARIGECLASAFALTGLFGVDVVLDEEQIWPIEVNPRYTASVEVLERGTGLRAVHCHVKACTTGELPEIEQSSNASAVFGKSIVYAQQDCTITEHFTDALMDWNGGDPWPAVADIPNAGSMIGAGRPIATVFAEGATRADIRNELQGRKTQLYKLLANARSR